MPTDADGGVHPLTVLLAGVGVWIFLEGAAYAVAPDLMRKLAEELSRLPPRELALAGLAAAFVGAGIVFMSVRMA